TLAPNEVGSEDASYMGVGLVDTSPIRPYRSSPEVFEFFVGAATKQKRSSGRLDWTRKLRSTAGFWRGVVAGRGRITHDVRLWFICEGCRRCCILNAQETT